jgi:hypothetical protein
LPKGNRMTERKPFPVSLYLYGSQIDGTARPDSDVDVIFVTPTKRLYDIEILRKKIQSLNPAWKNKRIDIKFLAIDGSVKQKSYISAHLVYASKLISGPDIRSQIKVGDHIEFIKSTLDRVKQFVGDFQITTDRSFVKACMNSKNLKPLYRCLFHIALVIQMSKDKKIYFREDQITDPVFKEAQSYIKNKWNFVRPDDPKDKEKLMEFSIKAGLTLSNLKIISRQIRKAA